MAAFDEFVDKLVQEIGSRYCLGPKAYPLVQETLGLIKRQPGGIGGFVNRFKAAGFAVEVASWLGGPDPVPLSGQEVEQTLGSDVISGIANKIGLSQRFARTILGYAIPKIIVLRAQDGAIPSAIRASVSSFLESAIPLSSSPVEEITQHRAEQIRPSRTEHGGPAPVLGLIIPSAALLITLGLLLGYFIGAGDRGAIQSAAIVAQNAPAPGSQALFDGDAVTVRGTIPDADRDRIMSSLKSPLGPQFAFATIAGSGATNQVCAPNQSALKSFVAVKGILHAPSTKPAISPERRDALLAAIAKARGWIEGIRLGRFASFAEIAEHEAQGERHIRLLAPLALLSPRIIAAIVNATAPTDLTVTGLAKALPYSWAEQERRIGLPL